MMSRKHYQAFAEMIAVAVCDGELSEVGAGTMVSRMAGVFAKDNDRFDKERFRSAVYDRIAAEQGEDDDDDGDDEDENDDR